MLTRFSTLARLIQSSGLNIRFELWAALLSNWTLEIRRCEKGEDEILGFLAASITPRKEVDEMLIAIATSKQPRQKVSMPPLRSKRKKISDWLCFYGSARVKRICGPCSAIVWRLPGWKVVAAASDLVPDLTVNEDEYRGLLLCFDMLKDQTRGRVVICGDSN